MRFASISALVFLMGLVHFLHVSNLVSAQGMRSELPRTEYYIALEVLGAGRLPEAMEGFNAALARARRLGENRWIDSIPPLVMLGECQYQQGNLALAMEQYDAALQLALTHSGWVERLQPGQQPLAEFDGTVKGISWFKASLASQSVVVPQTVQVVLDDAQPKAVPGAGGGTNNDLVTSLDAAEVMRSLALAMLRRWEILGPLSQHSPLSEPLSRMLEHAPDRAANWMKSSWTLLLGISQLSTAPPANSQALIRSSLLLQERFDYCLTPIGLLALAKLEAAAGNIPTALKMAQDASLLAARYEQHVELAEALRLVAAYASASSRTDLIDGLRSAAAWSTKRSILARIVATVGTAELAVYANDLSLAEQLIAQVVPALNSRGIALPHCQAHADFTTALIAFRRNKAALGFSRIDSALQLMRGTADGGAVVERVFQGQLALNLLAEGRLSAAEAERVLRDVLDDTAPMSWQLEPLESLAFLTTPSLPAYQRLLDLVEMEGDVELIVEQLDRLQRQRFYESLPWGGRLLCWRKAVAMQAAGLPASLRPILEATHQRFPGLRDSLDRIESLSSQLQKGPPPLDERQLSSDLKRTFKELKEASEEHESQIAFQALLRRPLPRFLPSTSTLVEIQNLLHSQDLVLAFGQVRQRFLGLAISRQSVDQWEIEDVPSLSDELKLLRSSLGVISGELPKLPSTVLNDQAAWRMHARNLAKLLFPSEIQARIANAERLLIAPQERLWYVPFELLPTLDSGAPSRLIAEKAITYIPTLGSCPLVFRSKATQIDRSTGVVGNFFAMDREANQRLVNRVEGSSSTSEIVYLNRKITAPNPLWLRLYCDQLWLAASIEVGNRAYDTAVIPFAKPTPSTLGSWLRTPSDVPSSVLLPGFTSSIASEETQDGDDLFLPICGLLTSGVESAIISRWPVGGVSTASLLSNYVREYETEPSSAALRRSILLLWAEEYLVAGEPALLPAGKEAETVISGFHPALWAGYMAVGDTQSAD